MNNFNETIKIRQKLASDPYRPCFHFLAPTQWTGAPTSLIAWQGEYHLFYQYNPQKNTQELLHWGHASSEDFIHWLDRPIALMPEQHAADQLGCWGGCVVNNQGTPTIMYSGRHLENQQLLNCNLAISQDNLTSWQKYSRNPLTIPPPTDDTVLFLRDPYIWQHQNQWSLIIAAQLKERGNSILLYTSADLIHWQYINILVYNNLNEESRWITPTLIALDNQHLLLVSVYQAETYLYSLYWLGYYHEQRFIPKSDFPQKLDFGEGYFCVPQLVFDAQKRWIMYGWIQEDSTIQTQRPWAGVLSLPRVIQVQANQLQVHIAEEYQQLREQHYQFRNFTLVEGRPTILEGVKSDSLEIWLEIALHQAQQVGVKLRCSPAEEEVTLIKFNRLTEELSLDRQNSSLNPATNKHKQSAQLQLLPQEHLVLHIFLDRSVLEIIANDRICLTSRIYPTLSASTGLKLFAFGHDAQVCSVHVWTLKSIW
ncbi:MAG: glycoside hydrolase family 32 protein [Pseudomonadota bacterium]|nr:glycoside hydrolase family 32 protein [Pseudomonadota bacterium]